MPIDTVQKIGYDKISNRRLGIFYKEIKMIWISSGVVKLEDCEPIIRSCWECNVAHEHLKKVNVLHHCLWCERFWVFDKYMDSHKSDSDFDAFCIEKGLTYGDSTQTIDTGYRLMTVKFGPT